MTVVDQIELESYLLGAANILRNIIDAGDYKQYIFPLLFYKRICDVYDEEFKKTLEESGGDIEYAEFSENHRFQIPKESHWNVLRTITKDLGKKIQDSMREIEKSNPDTLFGIFGDAQWTNKKRFSDNILKDLIEHFSSIDLSLEHIPQDQLGEGYEYLIKNFADDSGHNAQEFYTNRTIVSLMAELLDPQPGESIYDPTCGSGGMLLVAALHVKNKANEYRNLKLYGQEINTISSSIARMNLYLHGIEDFKVIRGNTLDNPAFTKSDHLEKFDVILANPPYSIKSWNREAWVNDKWGRNVYGTPPQGRADYAFFQHIIKSMNNQSGRCSILFPLGVLFREDEKLMRIKLIKDDKIECVIGLAPNLFYNSPMEACVVICKSKKPENRKNKILLINAIDLAKREKGQSFLEPVHLKKIKEAYKEFKNILEFSKVLNTSEALENNGSLSIPLYIKSNNTREEFNDSILQDLIEEWNENSIKLRDQYKYFLSMLEGIDLNE